MNIPCLLPPTPLADPSDDAIDSCCATVYDPDDFAIVLSTDPARAITMLAQLTPPQRLCQALEQLRWRQRQEQSAAFEAVLMTWQREASHQACRDSVKGPTESTVPMTTLILLLAADPLDAAVLLAAVPRAERYAAAEEHAHWLSTRGLARTVDEVLADWEALVAYTYTRDEQEDPDAS